MLFRPFKTLFSVNATFKNLDADGSSHLGQKAVFILGNLVNVGLAMYKCHSMGMLPTYARYGHSIILSLIHLCKRNH